jgi:hypothetical protein
VRQFGAKNEGSPSHQSRGRHPASRALPFISNGRAQWHLGFFSF